VPGIELKAKLMRKEEALRKSSGLLSGKVKEPCLLTGTGYL